MIYPTDALQTVAACDAMLTLANNERIAQVGKQARLQTEQINSQKDAVDIEASIPAVEAKVAFLLAMVPTLPAGTIRDEQEYDLRKEQNKLHLLKNRQENHGTFAMLGNLRELAIAAHEIAESDALIAAIRDRKAAIQ